MTWFCLKLLAWVRVGLPMSSDDQNKQGSGFDQNLTNLDSNAKEDLSSADSLRQSAEKIASGGSTPQTGPDAPAEQSETLDAQVDSALDFSAQDPGGLLEVARRTSGAMLLSWLGSDVATGAPGNGDVGTVDAGVAAPDDRDASAGVVLQPTTAKASDVPDDLSLSQANGAENAAKGTFVDTVSGPEEDAGDRARDSLGDDVDSHPAIDAISGQFTAVDGLPLKHEATNNPGVTARVTDATGPSDDETTTVGDVNEAPVAVDDAATTAENSAITVDVLANDTDPDAGDTQSLSSATLASGSGTVTVVGGEVHFDPGAAYDHLAVGRNGHGRDRLCRVRQRRADRHRSSRADRDRQQRRTDRRDGAGRSGRDGRCRVQLHRSGRQFSDLDASDTLAYTATLADGSALPGWLSFDAATRTFSGTPDNGDVGSIDVRVTATDDHGASIDDVFQLTTANANDAPDDLSLSNASVNENVATGTVAGTVTGTDADAGDTLTYSLVDDAGGRFAIDGGSGELTVAAGLDHEAADSHDVTVRVTDAAGASYDETFTINVGDVNEAPVAVDDSATTAENSAITSMS